MTDKEKTAQKIKEMWLKHELYIFFAPYYFMFGEEYVNKEMPRLEREFLNKWEKMTDEEKQARFDVFIKILEQEADK